MSLDLRKLQTLYNSDALARAILDTLKEEGAAQVPQVAELTGDCDNVKECAHLDESGRAQAVVRALKSIAKTGCGTFIGGREGDGSSRMSWDLEPEEIYAFATGGGGGARRGRSRDAARAARRRVDGTSLPPRANIRLLTAWRVLRRDSPRLLPGADHWTHVRRPPGEG